MALCVRLIYQNIVGAIGYISAFYNLHIAVSGIATLDPKIKTLRPDTGHHCGDDCGVVVVVIVITVTNINRSIIIIISFYVVIVMVMSEKVFSMIAGVTILFD